MSGLWRLDQMGVLPEVASRPFCWTTSSDAVAFTEALYPARSERENEKVGAFE